VTESQGNDRCRLASQGLSKTALSPGNGKKDKAAVQDHVGGKLQPAGQSADDRDHFYCTLLFTVKSKDESTT
jgi:hypothetical protein